MQGPRHTQISSRNGFSENFFEFDSRLSYANATLITESPHQKLAYVLGKLRKHKSQKSHGNFARKTR